MAVTRIKNNQITDSTITAAKIASGTLTGGLFAADITLASNVTITGNLTVSGASDSISATNTYVNDPLVVFNNGFVGSPSYDIGILVNRNLTATAPYGSVNAALIWRESDKSFSGLMTTETGATTGSINNSGFANLRIGNVTANSLTLTTGTLTASGGITGTPISGSTGYFTVLQGTAFSTANAVISGGSLNNTIIGNATAASGWFTTLYGANFSTGNAVISGGYISALTNATITTATVTTLNAGTTTSAVLNATAGNITTGYFGSLNTANAVITGGYVNGLANLTATTAQATNFSSGNIYATGTTTGTWSTANVSLYQQLAASSTNANLSIPFYDKATGNAAAYTGSNFLYNPSTNTLFVGTIATNGGNIGSAGGTTSLATLFATNFSSGNIYATGTTAGTWSTANVSLYQQLATGAQSGNTYVSFYDKATGNAAAYTNSGIIFSPSTGTLYVPNVVTNSGGGASFPTLYVGNFSSPNVVISGGYISSLTNATITTATTTTLNAVTATAATLNATAGNITTLYAGSVNTANAVITGGYINNLANLTATTAFATNFSSGNIYATGTTAGTWSTANVSLFDSVTALTTNQTFYPQFSNISTTGNTITGVSSSLSYNASTGALTATSLNGNHYGTTAQFTNFSTGNAVISGGYISALTNATVTTGSIGTLTAAVLNTSAANVTGALFASSLNTANAVIAGGYVNGLANLTATTTQTTNFSTGNAQITGGTLSGLTAITATTGNFGTATAAVLNSSAANVTGALFASSLNTANAVISGGYISALANATVTTASITNLAATTATATNFASGNVAVTGGYINSLANLTATTAQATNFSTGNAVITGGSINSTTVGATTKSTGGFTTLTATGVTTLTNGTDATSTSTGALQVTGGIGVLGNVWIGGNLYVANIVSTTQSILTITDPLVYLQAANPSGTYNYDIGFYSDNTIAGIYSHTGLARNSSANVWTFFSNVASEPSATSINWNDAGLIYDTVKAGALILANSTPSTTTGTGALQVAGGAGIVGNLNAGNVTTSMTTGTVMGNVGNFNNIYGTFYGTVAGGAGSSNVSLYQALNSTTTNATFYVPVYDKATGNAAAYTNSSLTYNPSTTTLTATTISATNGAITTLGATNFSTGNAVITGGSATALTNFSATTAFATNFSSGNIYFTNSTSGTVATSNVSLYDSTSATTTNGTFYPQVVDKATGNVATYSVSSFTINPSTGALAATSLTGNHYGTTAQFTNFSSGNVFVSGGYINNLANITAVSSIIGTMNTSAANISGPLFASSLNTANAVITGGSATALTNFSATTAQATNFSSGNVVISGGYISTLTNATITTATVTTLNASTTTSAVLNATAGNITTGYFGSLNTANAVITGGSATALTNFSATTAQATNFSSGNAVITGGTLSGLTAITATTGNFGTATAATLNATAGNITTGYFGSLNTANAVITGGYISALTNATVTTGSFGTATAATLNATAGNITTLAAGSLNTANAVISGGYISALTNATITTATITNFASGNLNATGTTNGTWSTANVSLYDSITATSTNANFYPQVVDKATGNAAAYSVSTFTINPSTGLLSATTFSGSGASLTNLPATAVVGTVATANVSLYDNISASTTNATFYPQLADKATGNAASFSAAYVTVNPSTNTLSANVFSGAVTATTVTASSTIVSTGNVVAASSTDSTSTTTGALVVVGGVGIAGNVYHGKAAVFNSSKTAGMDFVVKGKTDETLIWARPGASYDQVVIGNSATTSTLVTGAKLIVNTTDSIMVPVGTTSQRPSSTGGTDTAGMVRYNSTSNVLEFYNGSAWVSASSIFTTVTDTQFNGDGSTVGFTSANFSSATTNGIIVSINGVVQIPSLAYSLTGTTITFTEAPASGDVIDVRVLLTSSTATSISSANGYMTVSADNNGVYITGGTSSATNRMVIDTSGNINISGSILPSANVSYNLGNATSWFGTFYGVSTQAKYADLAENYQSDKAYNPGTVLMFGGVCEVTIADANTTAVAGVVSTNPAHLMNGQLSGSNVVPLALTGRVPCMVIGPVKKGDMMVSAGFGYAKASTNPTVGQVIGKALEDFPIQAKGVIEVVVGRL